MSTTAAASHKVAAERSYATAKRLERVNDEWAAVCYFYAAYRAVRGAMCTDPRLDSDANARAVDGRLTASSRHVDFHNGHPNRGPGVNQLVKILYPPIGSDYELLHIQSINVRYSNGLNGVTIADMRSLSDNVSAHLKSAGLA